MNRLGKHFFEGLLFVAPIAFTLYVCYWVFDLVNEPLQRLIGNVLGATIPGAGFIAAVLVGLPAITFIGFLCSNIVTGSVLRFIERQFDRFPFIKLVHSSLKDLVGAFVGEKKKFDRPVKVELTPGGVGVIGFITRDDLADLGLGDDVAVYLPMSYNFAGNLIIVPCERVTPLEASGGDVMTFILSGGISGRETRPGLSPGVA